MSTQIVANHRNNAEIFPGKAICKQKSWELLKEISLPEGLLPLDDLIEVGYNRTTSFVWLKQTKTKEHKFRHIGCTAFYDEEAFIEERQMKRFTGVESKELLIWVSVSDIFINDQSFGKITFANPFGMSRSFSVLAFGLEEENGGKKMIDLDEFLRFQKRGQNLLNC